MIFYYYICIKFKNTYMLFRSKKNKLQFYREYTHYSDYSSENRLWKTTIDTIQKRFEKRREVLGVYITSKFNGLIYPVYDLDSIKHLALFKKIFISTPYVIFESSKGHYWGIVDNPTKKIVNILEKDPSWKVCNDSEYVSFCTYKKKLFLRGLYENYDRKPFIYETNGILSVNLQLFVDKLNKFYNNEGFEFSVLKYNSEELLEELMIRKRTEKIKKTI